MRGTFRVRIGRIIFENILNLRKEKIMFPDEFDGYENLENWQYTNREKNRVDENDCRISSMPCCGNTCCGDCCIGPMGPRGPRGFQGPAGQAGTGLETVIPCVEGSFYRAGTMVFYNGAMYQVAGDNPMGIPGVSPDFLLVTAAGPTGPQGPAGAPGEVGPAGPAGAPGAVGPTGPAGPAGVPGAVGPVGPAGAPGAVGPTGPAGAPGAVGPAGPVGAPGAVGPTGPAGIPGAVGPTGPAGVPGAMGPKGPAGVSGAMGPTGPAGAPGAAGPTGPAGAPGAMGPTGPTGPAGPAGTGLDNVEAFVPGKPYTARKMIFNNGALYQVVKDNPTGTPGNSPDYALVTAAGPAGPAGAGLDSVEAFVSGKPYTARKMVFNNGALYQVLKDNPTGTPGNSPDYALVTATGPTGPQGPAGIAGTAGPTGPQGPAGAAGPTGPQGPAGTAGATGPTGPQGPAGVTGLAGPQGPAGPTGPQGPAGTAGATGPTGPAGPPAPAQELNLMSAVNIMVLEAEANTALNFDYDRLEAGTAISYSTSTKNFILSEKGYYEIHYYSACGCDSSGTVPVTLSLMLTNNGTFIPGTLSAATISSKDESSNLLGNVIVNVASPPVNIALMAGMKGRYGGLSLTIRKLN